MRAALFETFRGPIAIRDVADPACPADGVIVAFKACGVCRSDHHAWAGVDPDVTPPHVPGHEFAGVVIETGRDCRRWRKGDRVTAPFILACGHCPDCLAGDATVCASQHVVGFSSWGAFAERLPQQRNITDERAFFEGALAHHPHFCPAFSFFRNSRSGL